MPRPAGSVLLGALSAVSGLEDASCLFQQRRESERGAVTLEQLPTVGPSGFSLTRTDLDVAAGNSFSLSLKPWCNDGDEYGPKKCVAFYNSWTSGQLYFNIVGGVQPGDTLETSVKAAFTTAEDATPWAKFWPKDLEMTHMCTACSGICTSTFENPNVALTFKHPTTLFPPTCDDPSDTSDYSANLTSGLWLVHPGEIAPEGKINTALKLKDSSGTARLSANYTLTYTQTDAITSLFQDTANKDQVTLSLPEVVKETMRSAVTDTLQQLEHSMPEGAANLMQVEDQREMLIVDFKLEYEIVKIENGVGELTVTGDGCTSSATGFVCQWPMNTSQAVEASLTFQRTFGERTAIIISNDVSTEGVFNKFLKNFIRQPQKIRTAACLKNPAPTMITGFKQYYMPRACGEYELALSTKTPLNFDLPKIFDQYLTKVPFMPFLPRQFSKLMPIQLVTNIQLLDNTNGADGEAFVNVNIKSSLVTS